MARSDLGSLGIDVRESEIRVVNVKYRGNRAVVVGSAHAPTPKGAMDGHRILDLGALALALRRLIDSMNVGSGSKAVVGIPGGVNLRNLALPPVPDAELPLIVQTEVEHQMLNRSTGGSYAFLKLQRPVEEQQGAQKVVVLSVEDEITRNLKSLFERVNLTIDSLEPTQYAMYRSVLLANPGVPTLVGIMVGTSNTEITFAQDGQLVAYRRIETGSRALMPRAQEAQSYSPFAETPELDEHGLSLTALDTLGTEVRRTLDYLFRENPGFVHVERLYLAVDDARVASLDSELSQRLGLAVELIAPFAGADLPQDKRENAENDRYAAAFGLAMRNAPSVYSKVPRIDLYSKERSATEQISNRRNFAGSIVISLTAIALAAVGFVLYQMQIESIERTVVVEQARAVEIKNETNLTLQERSRRAEQHRVLRREGVPITLIMDYVTSALEPGVGIQSIGINDNLKVSISGEASAEPAMIRTVQTLQRCPILGGLIIESYTRKEKAAGVTFQLSATTVPMDRIKLTETQENAN